MRILIIDDSRTTQDFLASLLAHAGYTEVHTVASAVSAFRLLGLDDPAAYPPPIDLILMDIAMAEVDGIEATRRIKALASFADIPIIMVTSREEPDTLQAAFDAGASDYVTKSAAPMELLARVRAVLRLKSEMDRRRSREQELLAVTEQLAAANEHLQELSTRDALTGVPNRRRFNEVLESEWRRAARLELMLSVLLIDIDYFKAYNDTYGHLRGDECLREVAQELQATVQRAGDLVARFGGEEFGVILPNTGVHGALSLAEHMQQRVADLAIPHRASGIHDRISLSIGIATAQPRPDTLPEDVLVAADRALYQAKAGGRNRIEVARDSSIPQLP